MSLEIAQDQRGDVQILTLTGRLDLDSAATLQLALEDVMAGGGKHIVLDAASLGYLSTAGLDVILATNDKLKSGGSLRVCGLNPGLREMVAAEDKQKRLTLYVDLAAAMANHPSARLDPALVSRAAGLIGAGSGAADKSAKADPDMAQAAARLLGVKPPKAPALPTKKIPLPEPVAAPAEPKKGVLDKLKGLFGGDD